MHLECAAHNMLRNTSRLLTASNSARILLRPQIATVQHRLLHAPVIFNWEDPLGSSNLFTEDELAISETARSYCQERMLPRVLGMRASLCSHSVKHC